MEKSTILFWIFEIIYFYLMFKLFNYFVTPVTYAIFGTYAFDLFVFLIFFVPITLILSKLTTDYFLN